MKISFDLLLIIVFSILLIGCSSNNNSYKLDDANYSDLDDTNYSDSQHSCGPLEWYENGQCCKAFSTGRYVDENGQCPGRSVPGYRVPDRGYSQRSCFTIHCK